MLGLSGRNLRKVVSSTFHAIDSSLQDAKHLPLDLTRDKYIIFSDMHKADKAAGIDECRPNEMLLCHVLEQYYHNDWRLVLNGDIEECWEAKPRAIIDAYRDTLYALERKFADKGEKFYTRIYGNHDDLWRHPAKVEKHLVPVLGPIQVHPALILGDNLVITHGHQGEGLDDTYSWFSRYFVRHPWRWIQRFSRISTARAATNHLIRWKRDQKLYRWARERRKVLIAGHTHRPMFQTYACRAELQEACASLENEVKTNPASYLMKANLELMQDLLRKGRGLGKWDDFTRDDQPLPCYFNTGAIVHKKGLTGIEIADGEIRLVKWALSDRLQSFPMITGRLGELFAAERTVLQSTDLEEVMALVKDRLLPAIPRQTDENDLEEAATPSSSHKIDHAA